MLLFRVIPYRYPEQVHQGRLYEVAVVRDLHSRRFTGKLEGL